MLYFSRCLIWQILTSPQKRHQPAWAAVTKCPRLGYFAQRSGGWKTTTTGRILGSTLSSAAGGCHPAVSSHGSPLWVRVRVGEGALVSLPLLPRTLILRDPGPTQQTSCNFTAFKASSPNAVRLGLELQHVDLGGVFSPQHQLAFCDEPLYDAPFCPTFKATLCSCLKCIFCQWHLYHLAAFLRE